MNWWRHVMAMELRKILAYRSDFWVTFLGQTFVQLFIARALWQSVFESQNTSEMNGYTLPMMTLYYLIVPIGTKMLSGENIGFLSREIYEGTFNRYLIYPLSFAHYKILTYLTYSLFFGLQMVILYTLYQGVFNTQDLTFANMGHLFSGVALFLVASLTYALMAMSIELIALWADNVWSLMVMMRFFTAFFGGGFIPLTFFPAWAVKVLAFTPFPYLISLPVRTVMGISLSVEVLNGVCVLFIWISVLAGVVHVLWKVGQKNYTGVGI